MRQYQTSIDFLELSSQALLDTLTGCFVPKTLLSCEKGAGGLGFKQALIDSSKFLLLKESCIIKDITQVPKTDLKGCVPLCHGIWPQRAL